MSTAHDLPIGEILDYAAVDAAQIAKLLSNAGVVPLSDVELLAQDVDAVGHGESVHRAPLIPFAFPERAPNARNGRLVDIRDSRSARSGSSR